MERRAEAHSLPPIIAEGEMPQGREIGIRIDQTLTQEATGTVMLELEAMGLDHVRTELSALAGEFKSRTD